MDDKAYKLTAEEIGSLLKIGAQDMRKIAAERDSLIKFAMAVEIIPRLERAGHMKFPQGMEMYKKAQKLSEKSMDELQKLAYLAKRAPAATNHGVNGLKDDTKVASASEYGNLTMAFIGLMSE